MTSDIKERYLKNWSDDMNSEMWTGVEMIKFAASIRAETLEECCKVVCLACAGRDKRKFLPAELVDGKWRHKLATPTSRKLAFKSFTCFAAAIRDAGKKE